MKPKLIFADEREEIAKRLQRAFDGCQGLKAICASPADLRQMDNLDAIFLPLPLAERWGAKPILFKAQILKTRGADEGMPPYVIAGGAFHPDQIRDVRYELRQVIASTLDAVESFNRENTEKIHTIGFWTEISGINELTPEEAGLIVREMYEDKIRVAA
jgi:hypothetical protein